MLGKANNTGSPNLAIYNVRKAFCGITKHALEIVPKLTDFFLFCLRGRAVWRVEVVSTGHFLGVGWIIFPFHFGMLILRDEIANLRSSVSEKGLHPCLFSTGRLGLGNEAWLTPGVQEKASVFLEEEGWEEPGQEENPEKGECLNPCGTSVCGWRLSPSGYGEE